MESHYGGFLKTARHEPFAVFDKGEVQALVAKWRSELPQVEIFYAVKANNHPALLKELAAQGGVNFDVTSPAEIDAVLDLEVPASKLLVSNPCKTQATLQRMVAHDIQLTCFDSESELEKLSETFPGAEVLLRLDVSDPRAMASLSSKYGAPEASEVPLLEAARRLNVSVAGVMFHIGSGATTPAAFTTGIARARRVLDAGRELGHPMRILDLGGGFTKANLPACAAAIRQALGAHFGEETKARVIAEPGRFLAASTLSIFSPVIGVNGTKVFLGDGIYGDFDEAAVRGGSLPHPIAVGDVESRPRRPVMLYGPTCDGLDVLAQGILLPELKRGDWLLFPGMGAYSWHACSSSFNGFSTDSYEVIDAEQARVACPVQHLGAK